MTCGVTSARVPMTQVEDMVETRVAQKISQVSGWLTPGQRPAVRVKAQCRAIAALGLTSETRAAMPAPSNSAKGSLDGPRGHLSANDRMQSAEDCKSADYRLRTARRPSWQISRPSNRAPNAAGADCKQRAMVMNVQRQPGANIIATADSIRQMLPQRPSLPKSVGTGAF